MNPGRVFFAGCFQIQRPEEVPHEKPSKFISFGGFFFRGGPFSPSCHGCLRALDYKTVNIITDKKWLSKMNQWYLNSVPLLAVEIALIEVAFITPYEIV